MSGKKKPQERLRTAILVLAVLIAVCAAVLLGFTLGRESEIHRNESSSVSASSDASGENDLLQAAETGPPSGSAGEAAAAADSDAASASGTGTGPAASENTADDKTSRTVGAEQASSKAETSESETAAVTPAANGHIVCIDPGHQDHGMSDTEPNGPGSSVMKAKLTSGTEGSASGKTEYEVNLEIALRLRDELEGRGYTVVMTREANDVELSNAERSQIANSAGAEIFVRLHCNSSENSSVKGVLAYVPSDGNPYLSEDVIRDSQRLGRILVDSQVSVTGQESRDLLYGDDMTGINWAEMPVTIIEMGFMSNPDEDLFLASDEGQNLIMIGLANGIDRYFAGE